jgi:hypothetical protein
VQSTPIDVQPFSVTSQAVTMTATCPSGAKALGGGGFTSVAIIGASLSSSNGSGWTMIVVNPSSATLTGLFAFAVCGSP